MAKRLSFTKYEQKILPNFRQKINCAESTEDLKKFFVYSTTELFDNVFEGQLDFTYEDIVLNPNEVPFYKVSDNLFKSEVFSRIWNQSDLPHLVANMARTVSNKYKHLSKKPEKTESKIRM